MRCVSKTKCMTVKVRGSKDAVSNSSCPASCAKTLEVARSLCALFLSCEN